VGGDVSPVVTVTEVGLMLQVGTVAADGGTPTIVGEMLHDKLTVPV
jgi:hypothetical protein